MNPDSTFAELKNCPKDVIYIEKHTHLKGTTPAELV